ncbi:WNK protein kinase [Vittaforma corneae ATCC 50505]|uniref:WNK protein kinase n=1 Tax=Vittaforma corneae (strain ATCC 50505) TaxID=993615 RepID=L2GNN1_VITCO|nr:WNK protein kinase [Vittaforma corneae ATCC 50505]ELA42224.1 WNK protein kinase [Vittaforma corneae ATCC 50505]
MQLSAKDKHLRYKKTKCILGEGSYKTVTKAIDEEEGKEVAYNEVKMKYCEDENQNVSSFSKEIALLKSVDHPNIIKIVDYWFSDDNFIFITEFMTGGSLKEYLQKHGPLSTKLIRKWGKQILEGLKYLHMLDPPIIHRDIKNDNIFVNTAIGEVKIGDLGLARERRHKRYTIVGTPHFMAREMFEGRDTLRRSTSMRLGWD